MLHSTLTVALTHSVKKSLDLTINQYGNLGKLVKKLFSTSSFNNTSIKVTPKEALLDNPPAIMVEGLKENQKVTLWNSYTDDIGLVFSSHAHYIADTNGLVDVCNQMSMGGKYKGIFPEGLVLAMHTAPPVYEKKEKLKWARLFKKNVEQPMKYTLKVVDGHVSENDLYASNSPELLGETVFLRHLMGPGVKRTEIENDKFKGVLFSPEGEGPFPVVLDLFGAESGSKEFRSAMLASYGYASMVLPYYNYKDIPPLKDRLNMEYFLNAVDYLNSMPEGSKKGVGLIGSSKGGEIGLTIGGLTDKLKACIAINSYHRSVDINFYLNNELYLPAYIGADGKSGVVFFNEEGHLVAFATDEHYRYDLEHMIPIEKINGDCHVLLAASDEDGGHGHRSAISFRERARHFEKQHFNCIIYPGSGHLLDPPFHSHISAVWNSVINIRQPDGSNFKGLPHHYGGNSYGMCQASKDLWRRTLALFHKRLVQDAGLPLNAAKLHPPYHH